MAENPPAYSDTIDQILQPITLILTNSIIHDDTKDATPLYQLNRAVAVLTAATKEVIFERIERNIKSATDEPSVKLRPRHIYTIKYMTKIPGGIGASVDGHSSPSVFIQSVSRRTLGHYGIRRSRLRLKKDLKVFPIDITGKKSEFGSLPSFEKDVKPMFHIQQGNDGRIIWSDSEHNVLALEHREQNQHKLSTTVQLDRYKMDVLVALWCGAVWQYADQNTQAAGGDEDSVHRKFRLAKEIQPTSKIMSAYGI